MLHAFQTSNKKRGAQHPSHSKPSAVPHPYGVKPAGNYYIDSSSDNFVDSRREGLGQFCRMEDSVIFQIFENFLAEDLSMVSMVSKVFYVFSQEEEFWKLLAVEKFDGNFTFKGSWKETYKRTHNPRHNYVHNPIQVTGFYSDYLYHIWRCTSVDLSQWNCVDNIDRRSNLSLQEFVEEYLIPNKPVVITDVVAKWPAFKEWSKEKLAKKFGDRKFYINSGVWMKLSDFFQYCTEVQEEMPMYLFDHDFGEHSPPLLDDYQIPDLFKEDFFSLLGDKRPSFRWLLAGPARSGATFHKDPNYTSAWNAVITGVKKWVLYPPHIMPPGIDQSDDGLEVASPVSIVEWFLNHYESPENDDDANCSSKKKQKNLVNGVIGKGKRRRGKKSDEIVECILKAGEMIFVPSTWWHTVLNLEESIAITQNFCNSYNIFNVLKFFEMKGKQNLGVQMLQKMEEQYPNLYEKLKKEKTDRDESKKTFWQKVELDDKASTFSFNFGS